ncbi:MAG: RIP metalloprotease RseP, partial [Gammaproteobacteria bacterium]
MNTILISVAAFVVTLGILITIHEFGHYWFARRLGVKVLRFSVGFGRPLWRRLAGPDQTEYVVAALPLGGYVKMLDEREGEVPPEQLHRAFNRKSVGRRAAIVFAGPLFNFLFAILAYWIMFVIGVDGVKPVVGEIQPASFAAQAGLKNGDEIVTVGGKPTPTWEAVLFILLDKVYDKGEIVLEVRDQDAQRRQHTLDLRGAPKGLDRGDLLENLGIRPVRPVLPPVIGEVEKGGAAEVAGLAKGDKILNADGAAIRNWDDWVNSVRSRPNQVIKVQIERAGALLTLEVKPAAIKAQTGTIGRIGAAPEPPTEIPTALRAVTRYNPAEALLRAGAKTWEMSALTLLVLGKMVTGQAALENLSGPLSIAQYAGYSAQDGLASFLRFLAIVSVSLGVLNLLPIPVLDGGHLLYYLVEAVSGRPIP